MKHFLFALLLLPLGVAAQKFDISIYGGSNTTFMLRSPIMNAYKLRPISSPIGGLTAMFLRKRTAIGISLRAYTMQGKTETTTPLYSFFDTGNYTYHEYFGKPTVEANLVIASNETFGNSTLLLGGQLGILINNANDVPFDGKVVTQPASYGMGIGFYARYTYYFGAVGLGLELSPKVNMFSARQWTNLMTSFTVPVMAGVHVRI